jgi:cysteinyl-tRNA synthetase
MSAERSSSLKLYDTLSRQKVPFVPLDYAPESRVPVGERKARMYVCGPTVYDYAHIGNARPVIVFDVLFRLLRHLYGADHVTYVRNLTDVDDKINKRAFERWDRKRPLNAEIRKLTETTAAQYQADVRALGCLDPTHQPRATEYVCDAAKPLDMVRIIEKLMARGHAYAADGHVLFHVPSMPAYGRLARRSLDEMVAGARVDVAPYKRDPMDFVLWKPSNPETEPGWDSTWGFGRPGWHIECSAMSGALLGEIFDIHAGGIDLVFPHHENEIAQTCCAFGTERMAQVWMHNGFLMVEGEKMSKSLGNFITINELLATEKFGGRKWPGEVLRLAMLKTHYRQPIDWTVRALEEAKANLEDWGRAAEASTDAPPAAFLDALADDLNTAEVVALFHRLRKEGRARELGAALAFMGLPLWKDAAPSLDPDATGLIEARLAARKARDFKESDRLRDLLLERGIRVKDGKDPATGEPMQTWEVVR